MAGSLGRYLSPKEPIPRWLYLAASGAMAIGLFAGWALLSYGGFVRTDFLPTPGAVVAAGLAALADRSLVEHTLASATVVISGFVLASLLAVPLGILMGSFKLVEAFVEPLTNFVRYLPVSAMIPLLILWIGIGIDQRIAVIFLGTVFQQVIMIADVSARVSRDLVDVSYTLGAGRRQVVTRVLIPACLPGVMDTLRVTMGWAWTYLVVAELVAANEGLGYMILNAMRGLFTDEIFLGILVIGLLGLVTDQLLKVLKQRLLPWAVAR